MLRLPPLPRAPVLLLVPAVAVSTPEAYRLVDEARQGIGSRGAVALEPETLTTWGNVARLAGNDFEFALFGRHPELRRAHEALAGTHPILCRMTGSGSTIIAVYRSARERDDARLALSPKLGTVLAVETVTNG
jgi:4-diphosphocytidyl-2-C-methyl-D-erythritol kinase